MVELLMSMEGFSAFAHLNVDRAPLYRAVLSTFTEAKSRFVIHVRPQEVLGCIQAAHPDLLDPVPGSEGATGASFAGGAGLQRVEAALRQLCEWGNLDAHPDTTEVSTVEEFYRPRYLYQLTREGEAAEQAVAVFREALEREGELQAAALSDLREILGELEVLSAAEDLDQAKVHRTLSSLRGRFEELTSRAQTFLGGLQRTIDLQGIAIDAFLAYKDRLIEYLERFIGELVLMGAEIAARLRRLEAAGVDRLLAAAAARDLADALAPTEEDHAAARETWMRRWEGLAAWFIRGPDAPSQAEVLRSHARAAIPALLGAVSSINDRRSTRSDRATDLLALARWFAETGTLAEAHRLWRAAFALSPARHLRIDAATLEARDQDPVPARTSWLDAPPILVSPRLRRTGRYRRRGAPRQIIDRTAEKRILEEAARAEAGQILAAEERLAGKGRLRLSELGRLDSLEFQLFLDLLGEALSRKIRPDEAVEATSSDGSLRIALEPTADGAEAVIDTTDGEFRGRDHCITIRCAFAPAEEDEEAAPAPARAGAESER
jgi:uncharacterized protein (TIGR02677 family)